MQVITYVANAVKVASVNDNTLFKKRQLSGRLLKAWNKPQIHLPSKHTEHDISLTQNIQYIRKAKLYLQQLFSCICIMQKFM